MTNSMLKTGDGFNGNYTQGSSLTGASYGGKVGKLLTEDGTEMNKTNLKIIDSIVGNNGGLIEKNWNDYSIGDIWTTGEAWGGKWTSPMGVTYKDVRTVVCTPTIQNTYYFFIFANRHQSGGNILDYNLGEIDDTARIDYAARDEVLNQFVNKFSYLWLMADGTPLHKAPQPIS